MKLTWVQVFAGLLVLFTSDLVDLQAELMKQPLNNKFQKVMFAKMPTSVPKNKTFGALEFNSLMKSAREVGCLVIFSAIARTPNKSLAVTRANCFWMLAGMDSKYS